MKGYSENDLYQTYDNPPLITPLVPQHMPTHTYIESSVNDKLTLGLVESESDSARVVTTTKSTEIIQLGFLRFRE